MTAAPIAPPRCKLTSNLMPPRQCKLTAIIMPPSDEGAMMRCKSRCGALVGEAGCTLPLRIA